MSEYHLYCISESEEFLDKERMLKILSKLKSIEILETYPSQFILECLLENTTIEKLYMDDVFEEIDMSTLQSVLSNGRIKKWGLNNWDQSHIVLNLLDWDEITLDELELYVATFNVPGFEGFVNEISQNNTITRLSFRGCKLGDEYAPAMAQLILRMPRLVDLELITNFFTNQGLAQLVIPISKGTITHFDISDNPLSKLDSIIDNIGIMLRKLTTFKIGEAIIFQDGLKTFADSLDMAARLDYLLVNEIELTPLFFAHLKTGFDRLTTLRLDTCQIGIDAAPYLADIIRKKNLKELDLSRNNIQSDSLEILIEAVIENPNLKLLDLSENFFGDYGFKQISNLLKRATGLKDLILDMNPIGLTSMRYLAEGLLCNRTLETLSIEDCQFSPDNIPVLYKALQKNKTLFGLYIHFYQNIADLDCYCAGLASLLSVNRGIRQLSCPSFSKERLETMADAVENNYAITWIGFPDSQQFDATLRYGLKFNYGIFSPVTDRNKDVQLFRSRGLVQIARMLILLDIPYDVAVQLFNTYFSFSSLALRDLATFRRALMTRKTIGKFVDCLDFSVEIFTRKCKEILE
ncbi:NACHT, LRR and PYD domains-containing protein 13 [Terramyces sp. JEL0728]|nr:NACHT, LRR and PYD domains-containing protein 13 [Terramyces sp. JEL0728]